MVFLLALKMSKEIVQSSYEGGHIPWESYYFDWVVLLL